MALMLRVRAEDNTFREFDAITTNLNGSLVVGAAGTNNGVIITNASIITSSGGVLGVDVGANGNFTIITGSDSLWRCNQELDVGRRGSQNIVMVTNGATLFSGSAWVGAFETSRSNSVVVSGIGSMWTNATAVMIGGGFQPALLQLVDGGQLHTLECGILSHASVSGRGSYLNTDTLQVATHLAVSGGGRVDCRTARFGFGAVARQIIVDISGRDSTWTVAGLLEMETGAGQLRVRQGARVDCGIGEVRGDQLVSLEDPDSTWVVHSRLEMDGWYGQAAKTNQLTIARGGTLAVTNESGDAVFALGDARVVLEGGQIQVDRWLATNAPSTLELRFGTVRFGEARWRHSGRTLVLGDESGVGALEIGGGYLTVNTNVVLLSNVVLSARGEWSGQVTNRGVLRPGKPALLVGQPGSPGFGLNFYNQGTVHSDISGESEGVDYGVLVVRNRALLGGRLEVGLGTGYRPAWTNQFVVMRWRTREGAFTNAPPGSRLSVGAGSFRVVYTADALVLTDYVEDLDGDQVDDLWAQSYFGHSPLTLAELAIDSDGDGSSNAAEYLAGTDPGDGGSVFGVRSVVADPVGVRLRFPAVLGRGYRVWYATALPDWAEVLDPAFTESGPGELEWLDDGSQTGQPPGGVGARFYRLGVE